MLVELIKVLYSDYTLLMQLCGVLALGTIAHFFAQRLLKRVEIRAAKTKGIWDDVLLYAISKPLIIGVWLLAFSYSIQLIDSKYDEVSFTQYLEYLRGVSFSVLVGWFLYRLIEDTEQKLVVAGTSSMDRTTINAISRLLRIILVIIISFMVIQNLGYQISSFITFGALSTLVLAIGAKDVISNIGGGVMIYFDRPFEVGEWIRSPDQEIEGNVEYIGWRLTRIRTLDKRALYVPNSVFANISIENPSRMTNRRIRTFINLRYEDAKQIPLILADIRRMMVTHEELDMSKTCIVAVTELSAYSMICMISGFTKTIDTEKYHMVQQDVLLRTVAIITGHGAKMAYPVSVTHIPDKIEVKTN